MRAAYNVSAPKRAVNLSLNEDLVTQVRGVADTFPKWSNPYWPISSSRKRAAARLRPRH